MRKLITLFLMFFVANAYLFAYEGGSVSANPGGTTVNPIAPVTITYNGTGTNFANWTPKCHAHMWLNDASGNNIATTTWIDYQGKGGDDAWALVPDRQKMTNVETGKYQITIDNVFEYFNVAEADKSKVAKFGIIVRAQYDGDNNRTESMYLDVEISADPFITLTAPAHAYKGEEVSLSASAENITNPVITYSVKAPGAGDFTAITLPYTATVTGNHTFKVDVTEGGSGPVLASDEKDVMVYAKIIGGSKFYLTPNTNWKKDGARFALHYFGDGENTAWADLVEVEPDIYGAVTPAGNWTTIIYARMSSGTTENNWDNRWNQTSNLKYDGVNNHYTVTGESWTDGTGEWSVYVEHPSVNFSNLKAYAFEGDQITLSATSNNVENPVYTYSVKAPAAESFVTITSPYSPSATGIYTFKVEVAENGNATVLASAQKEVTVLELPKPIVITVQVPDDWTNTHFWYWTTFDGLGGWVEPTLLTNTVQTGAKVYRYTFTHFDELNFLVANGNDWDAAPVQTINTHDVKEKSCYLVSDEIDDEGKYNITKVACDALLTSVEKPEQLPLVVRVDNKTIEISSEKQASVELYSITGQLIRSAQNVNSFTQKVNSGVYVLRIDGKVRKVMVND